TKDVSQTGRSTMGVRLIKVNDDSKVASLTIVPTEAEQNQTDDDE
nr:DNA gyrase C-terminal beta-propeller domain-containing protein [Lactobacillus amylovorus]